MWGTSNALAAREPPGSSAIRPKERPPKRGGGVAAARRELGSPDAPFGHPVRGAFESCLQGPGRLETPQRTTSRRAMSISLRFLRIRAKNGIFVPKKLSTDFVSKLGARETEYRPNPSFNRNSDRSDISSSLGATRRTRRRAIVLRARTCARDVAFANGALAPVSESNMFRSQMASDVLGVHERSPISASLWSVGAQPAIPTSVTTSRSSDLRKTMVTIEHTACHVRSWQS